MLNDAIRPDVSVVHKNYGSCPLIHPNYFHFFFTFGWPVSVCAWILHNSAQCICMFLGSGLWLGPVTPIVAKNTQKNNFGELTDKYRNYHIHRPFTVKRSKMMLCCINDMNCCECVTTSRAWCKASSSQSHSAVLQWRLPEWRHTGHASWHIVDSLFWSASSSSQRCSVSRRVMFTIANDL